MNYHVYRIPKGKGKFRIITEPSEQLKQIQEEIKVDLDQLPVSPWAHGFVLRRSPITNALPHRQQRYVLKIDIKNFFPSVHWLLINSSLYTVNASTELIDLVDQYCMYRGGLPQGASTSPVLANLALSGFDLTFARQLSSIDSGLVYTRYADDLTISGNDSLKELRSHVLDLVSEGLALRGLQVNDRKTKLMPYYQRQLVTGIVVNNKRLTLSRRLREELFQVMLRREPDDISVNEAGYLEYIRSIDPRAYNKLCKALAKQTKP